VKVKKDQLVIWERSQSEILSLNTALLEGQKELKFRVEELRAAKKSNQELGNLMQKNSISFSNGTNGVMLATGSQGSLLEGSDEKSQLTVGSEKDVDKLNTEIKVIKTRSFTVTSLLSFPLFFYHLYPFSSFFILI
jgi:hypothetical protein